MPATGKAAQKKHDGSRSRQHVFAGLYAGTALAALYFVHIRPYQLGLPVHLDENLSRGVIAYPRDVIPALDIRQHYTGLEPIDAFFRRIVTIFIAGPAHLEERVWLQQFHFVFQFTPFLAIALVETRRQCWQRSVATRYTWTWNLASLLLSPAAIQPLYLLSLILISDDSSMIDAAQSHLAVNQSLDFLAASATLPAFMLGYVLPCLLMYLWQFIDIGTMMGLIVYWSFAPVAMDLLMVSLEPLVSVPEDLSAKQRRTRRAEADLLNPLYWNVAGIAAASHLFSIYIIATASAPLALFSSAFIPSTKDALTSTSAGTHNVLLWQEIFCSLMMVLWTLQASYELRAANLTTPNNVVITLTVLLLSVAIGPGATIALTWYWREGKLVRLADRDLQMEQTKKTT